MLVDAQMHKYTILMNFEKNGCSDLQIRRI